MNVKNTAGAVEEQETADVEQWLDELDPATTPARDGAHLRRIRAAADEVVAAEARLREAVAVSRAHGDTWGLIGMVLGTSRQAAQQRFGAGNANLSDGA